MLGVAATGGALAITLLFLAGLAAKERDNRFCVSCHLHEDKYTRYVTAAPLDLAGAHRQADAAVGCIACHGGADLPMRLRVWAVAGFDTLRFLAGTYTEPDHMRLPLRDAECRQCHTPILKARSPQAAAPSAPSPTGEAGQEVILETLQSPPTGGTVAFHGMREHETVTVACIGCHASHVTGGEATPRFLVPAVVQPVCRECHPTM
ncbi:MAG TPA: hypothetical protein VFV05_01840 [Methylomirabilota bacterium]|nr:hypothetical protein [Methylomirabilota bacterium]